MPDCGVRRVNERCLCGGWLCLRSGSSVIFKFMLDGGFNAGELAFDVKCSRKVRRTGVQ